MRWTSCVHTCVGSGERRRPLPPPPPPVVHSGWRLVAAADGGSGLAAAVGVAISAYVERHAAVHRALASGRLGVLDHVVALGHQLTLRVPILGGVRVAVAVARRRRVARRVVLGVEEHMVRFEVHWTRKVGGRGVSKGHGTCNMPS